MTRWFFDQVDDEVRGLVGPALRNYHSEKNGRLVKVWYEDPAVHFEAQRLSPAWSPSRAPSMEVGLHLESRARDRNESILGRLLEKRSAWEDRFPDAAYGEAFGPQGPAWRRLSEVVEIDALDEDLAGEVADRIAAYIVTLQPLLATLAAR